MVTGTIDEERMLSYRDCIRAVLVLAEAERTPAGLQASRASYLALGSGVGTDKTVDAHLSHPYSEDPRVGPSK